MTCQVCHGAEARFERGRGPTRTRLCAACLTRSGLQHLDGWRLLPDPDAGPGPRCPSCHLGWSDFAKRGRYGCPECRAAFAARLGPLLSGAADQAPPAERWPLEADLSLALLLEDYELAARLRDRLENQEP